jgi:NADPH:quinone reductase
MRRIVCRELGPLENLAVEEVDEPEVSPGTILVDVEAAGVNFVDALIVRGEYQLKPPLPFVPGGEIAGRVLAVGDGVTTVQVGDRILGMTGFGGFAERVVIGAAQGSRVPPPIDATRAATFTQSYCTALFALRERAGLRPGETVLVLGAAGGVGRAAIDVSKALGARVIAAASSAARAGACKAAGADETIDYSREDLKSRVKQLGSVDVIVDPVGGDRAEPALRTLGVDGRYLVIGFAAGAIPRIPLNLVLLRNRRVVGVDWGAWMMSNPDAQRGQVGELLALVEAGRLHPQEPVTYALEDAATALADLLANRVAGKAALVPRRH